MKKNILFILFLFLCVQSVFSDIIADGTLATAVSAGPAYIVSTGTEKTGNLFHSFSEFNPQTTGDTVSFEVTANITHVLFRLGQGATINPALNAVFSTNGNGEKLTFLAKGESSLLENFNLGANVTSFHMVSGNLVRHNATEIFTNTTTAAQLSAITPERLGGAVAGDTITVASTGLVVQDTLALLSSEIELDNANITAYKIFMSADIGGELNLTTGALTDPNGNAISGDGAFVSDDTSISLTDSGSFILRAGSIVFQDTDTNTQGISGKGITVQLDAGTTISLDNTTMNSTSDTNAVAGGNVSLQAKGNITLDNISNIQTSHTGTGNAGSISLTSEDANIVLQGNTDLISQSAKGTSGAISLTASKGTITLTGGSELLANASDTGNGANVILQSKGDIGFTASGIKSSGNTAGSISLTTSNGNILFQSNTDIYSQTENGTAGAFNLTATLGSISFTGGSDIFANATGTGNGANITMTGRTDITFNASNMNVSGNIAGNINITSQTGNILFDAADISAVGQTLTANQGVTSIQSTEGTITFQNDSDITGYGADIKAKGNISFSQTSDIEMQAGGFKATSEEGSVLFDSSLLTAKSGAVELTGAVDVTFSNASTINTKGTALASNSGNVTITAQTGNILFEDNTDIISQSVNGTAGTVSLTSSQGTIRFIEGSAILANATGTGNGAGVTIQARGNVTFDASAIQSSGNTAGNVSITSNAGNILFDVNTDITAQGKDSTSGTVSITATQGTIGFLAGSEIFTDTTGTGNGASITIQGRGNVTFSDSDIKTNGDTAGNVSITSNNGNIIFNTNTDITTQGVNGTAGSVTLTASQGSITFTGGSEIFANTTGTGNGANISLTGKTDISLTASLLNTSGQTAGNVNITTNTGNILLDGTDILAVSQLTSSTQGTVTIQTTEGTITLQNDSDMTGYGADIKAKGNISFTQTSDVQMKAGGFKVASETGSVTFDSSLVTAANGNVDIQGQAAITFSNTSTITTQGAEANSNSGTVTISTQTGNILFEDNTDIITRSVNGNAGTVSLTTSQGTLRFIEGSEILANATGTGNGAAVTVQTRGDITFDASTIQSSGTTAGSVSLTSNAGNILFDTNTDIIAQSKAGTAGTVTITATEGTVSFLAGSEILANTTTTGNGSSVTIQAQGIVTFSDSDIKTNGATAGSVSITSNNGNIIFNTNTDITTQGVNGTAGSVTLTASQGSITFTGGSEIFANTTGTGNGANISLTGKTDISLTASLLNTSGQTAGNVNITTNTGNILLDGTDILAVSQLTSSTQGTVTIQTTEGTITLQNDSDMTGYGADIKAKGNVSFTQTSDVQMKAGGFKINAEEGGITFDSTLLTAQSGNVELQGQDDIIFSNTSTIDTKGTTLAANSGNVTIITQTGNILLEDNTDILTQSINGTAGTVSLTASQGTVRFIEGSAILSNSTGTGNGSAVTIQTRGDITFDSSIIQTSGNNAGNVSITSSNGNILFDNNTDINVQSKDGTAGTISLTATQGSVSFLAGSEILANSITTGNGGSLTIQAKGNVSFASSINTTGETGGNVSITSDSGDINLSNTMDIITQSTKGAAGSVSLTTTTGTITIDGRILANCTTELGNGGNITINARQGLAIQNSLLNSSGNSAGNISITSFTEDIHFDNGIDILAQNIEGNAATVTLNTTNGSVIFENGSDIFTDSRGTGNGGNVSIKAKTGVSFDDSDITTDGITAGTVTIEVATGNIVFEDADIVCVSLNPTSGKGTITFTASFGTIEFENSTITGYGFDGQANQNISFVDNSNVSTDIGDVKILSNTGSVTFNHSLITAKEGDVEITGKQGVFFQDVSNISTVGNAPGSIKINSVEGSISFQNSSMNTSSSGLNAGNTVDINNNSSIQLVSSNITTKGGSVTVTSTDNTVTFNQSAIDTSFSNTAGNVNINGNAGIAFSNQANIITNGANAGSINVVSNNGGIAFDNTNLTAITQSFNSQERTGGAITITAGSTVLFDNDSNIQTEAKSGTEWVVNINAGGKISFLSGSDISSPDASVRINTARDIFFEESKISANKQDNLKGGKISLNAGTDIVFQNNAIIETAPQIGTEWVVTMSAVGQISFSQNSDILTHGANVQISTTSSKFSMADSRIHTKESGTNSGKLEITANREISFIGSEIDTSSALNNAGDINLSSSGTILFDDSHIYGEGLSIQGSVININANNTLSFENESTINTSWNGTTNTMVNLQAGAKLSFSDNSGIVTKKGAVKIASSGSDVEFTDSYINTKAVSASQDAGNIEMTASQTLSFSSSTIDAATGDNALITMSADILKTENSVITTGSEKGTISLSSNNSNDTGSIKSTTLTTKTLNLNGLLDATDGSEFNAKTVNINGTLTSDDTLIINSDVSIAQSALLRSSCTINGKVENRGSLTPGNAQEERTPLTLKINGDYGSASGSVIAVDAHANGDHDKIEISGKASLNGTLYVIQAQEDNNYFAGTKYDIITAQGGVDGTFAQVNNTQINNLLYFDVHYENNFVELMVKRIPFQYLNFSDIRAKAVSKALDQRTDYSYNQDLAVILNHLEKQDTSTIQNAFVQMSGESLSGLGKVTLGHTHLFSNTILSELTYGQTDKKTSSPIYDFSQRVYDDMPLLAYSSDIKNLGIQKEEKKLDSQKYKEMSLFVRFMAGTGEQDESSLESTGYSFSTMGFAVGCNYNIYNYWLMGIHTGYASSDLNYKDYGSEGNVENIFAGVHTRFSYENTFVYAMLGYSYSSFEQDRRIIFPGVSRTAKSDFDGHAIYFAFHVGYDIYTKFEINPDYYPENLIITPVLGFQYIYHKIGRIEEKGANDLNLIVSAQEISSLRAELGVKFACPLKSDFVTLLPELRFLLIHEFMDSSKNLQATLAGNPGIPAKVPVSQKDDNIFLIGSRISATFHKAFSLILEYDVEFGSSSIYHLGKFTFQYDF
mgnify:CR=1 FL=1